MLERDKNYFMSLEMDFCPSFHIKGFFVWEIGFVVIELQHFTHFIAKLQYC